MIYTKFTKIAMRIAFDAHKEQKDKTGLPYVFHPFHLAEQMDTEDEVCVAFLHDVVEDSDVTLDDLRKVGFNNCIIDVLSLLTHEESVPYMDYIAQIKHNPIAVKVKLADLRHNSDLTRLDTVDEKMQKRVKKYKTAIALLENPSVG